MLWNIHNGHIQENGLDMYYASFGSGSDPVVLIPGLSDGLATVKGKALLLAFPYLKYLKEHTVYMFSRRNDLSEGHTIKDMAEDQAEAMKILGIRNACVAGISEGGMIAQYLAASHPELVRKLVLAVTAPCVNEIIRNNIRKWKESAENKDHRSLMIDTAEKSYSDKYLKTFRLIYPVIGLIGKPADYRRFLVNADAILSFDASGIPEQIRCPVLVIGGGCDRIVGAEASYELDRMLPDSSLYIYENLGHGAYEEAKDFNDRMFRFFDS